MKIFLVKYKFKLLSFLSKFIPYIKRMVDLTSENIKSKYYNELIVHFKNFDNQQAFNFDNGKIEELDNLTKTCKISYKVIYMKHIQFNLILTISRSITSKDFLIEFSKIESLCNVNSHEIEDIGKFCKHFENIKTKNLFIEYMKYVK